MKKIILITMLAILTTGMRAAQYDYLVFTLTDGTTKTVAASNLTISFSDGNLIAASGSETLATLSLAQLTQMEFSTDDPTGITTLSTNTLTTDEATAIYDMNGRQIPTGTSLKNGMYIVKTKSRTVKVYIR
ncbi:MAG: hypothetical protein J6035_01805 [Bacteroidaceae bacterium]|nr:hypothetical protein [Bacteroidaceae bacterium]